MLTGILTRILTRILTLNPSFEFYNFLFCISVSLGEIRSGAQEHFYMETNSCLAIPSNEDGELTVYASTQNPTEGQKLIAHALNISMNKVVVKVKRLGGGFGGKETRCTPLIVAAAFAASKVNLPVKFSLDRDQVIFKCITSLWDQTTKQ